MSEGSEGLSKVSEGLSEGSEGLSEGSEGLPEGPEGPEGLPEGPEEAWGGRTYGRTDVRLYIRTDGISPHSTGLRPLSGPLPKKCR